MHDDEFKRNEEMENKNKKKKLYLESIQKIKVND